MSGRIPLLIFAALLALPALAQSPSQSRVPTVTRLVRTFHELETKLAAQASANDTKSLDATLDPTFEMRTAEAPGAPIPRDEWIRNAHASHPVALTITQMAVHDFGDVAVVSFEETSSKPSRFVVDCWKRDVAGWKLAVRYRSDIAPVSAKRSRAPGTLDKRY
ncbi:MAG TPA: DUF4440 domain-containing protein [Casimicrobiaceae bacterium]|nr:DUF4440 domain-containing protein [Casimicrobiaceae bacterium]